MIAPPQVPADAARGGFVYESFGAAVDGDEVEFRLFAFSRAARTGPLLARTGFRLIGRIHQLRFYREVCRRARRLTEAQLETERALRRRPTTVVR